MTCLEHFGAIHLYSHVHPCLSGLEGNIYNHLLLIYFSSENHGFSMRNEGVMSAFLWVLPWVVYVKAMNHSKDSSIPWLCRSLASRSGRALRRCGATWSTAGTRYGPSLCWCSYLGHVGFPWPWGYPKSWMVFVWKETRKWMIWRYFHFRKPPCHVKPRLFTVW